MAQPDSRQHAAGYRGVLAEDGAGREAADHLQRPPAIGGEGIGAEGRLDPGADRILRAQHDAVRRVVEQPGMGLDRAGAVMRQLPAIGDAELGVGEGVDDAGDGVAVGRHRVLGQEDHHLDPRRQAIDRALAGAAMVELGARDDDHLGAGGAEAIHRVVGRAGIDDQQGARLEGLRLQRRQQGVEMLRRIESRNDQRDAVLGNPRPRPGQGLIRVEGRHAHLFALCVAVLSRNSSVPATRIHS
nr:hypothetical protein [Inquilinus limosus]